MKYKLIKEIERNSEPNNYFEVMFIETHIHQMKINRIKFNDRNIEKKLVLILKKKKCK